MIDELMSEIAVLEAQRAAVWAEHQAIKASLASAHAKVARICESQLKQAWPDGDSERTLTALIPMNSIQIIARRTKRIAWEQDGLAAMHRELAPSAYQDWLKAKFSVPENAFFRLPEGILKNELRSLRTITFSPPEFSTKDASDASNSDS